MQTVKRSAIIITANRQRRDFDAEHINGLSEAIRAKGLMHAPVMREENGTLVLVAGETRLKAIDQLWMLGGVLKFDGQIVPEGEVPYVTLGQLSPLEAEEAELDENLHRKDLTWQEQSAAMSKLHALRSKQAQAAGRVHTVADTAMETKGRSDGSYQQAVRMDLMVAKHLDNPAIARAKNVAEAVKILKKQEEQKQNIALAEEVGRTFNSETHQLFHVNCIAWLQTCQPEEFDVILTDPPYGMNAQNFQDGGDGRMVNSEHHYDDSYEAWIKLMEQWCPLSYKVAKAQAHAYVFCDIQNFPKLKELMELAGWYVFRTPFICHKPLSGRVPLPDQGPRRQYETLLYAIKGKKKTNCIKPDVISTTQDVVTTHGAQKPVALYADLLSRSVRPGDTVLDCFAGSGTIFPACHQANVKATGLEQSSEYYAISLKRLQNVDQEMPAAGVSHSESDSLMDELKGMM